MNGHTAWRFMSHVMPEAIISGWGCRTAIRQEVEALKLARVLVVCSPTLRSTTDFVRQIEDCLTGRVAGVCDTARPNNPEDALATAAKKWQGTSINGIISIGGGAVHDAAKGLALLLPNGGSIFDFAAKVDPPDQLQLALQNVDALPILTIPSTFSAAELVGGGAVTDKKTGQKHLFIHPKLTPRRVLLDGEVASTTARQVLACSGLNAVHHCLEALSSKGRQPITDALALAALRELLAVLPVFGSSNSAPPTSIQRALEASALSGLTYATSGLGIGHAVCHALCGRYDLPHAAVNAVVVRHSLRFNRQASRSALARAARTCAGASPELSDEEAVEKLISAVDELCRILRVPARLRDVGLNAANFVDVATAVLADVCIATNPRPVSKTDVAELIAAAY